MRFIDKTNSRTFGRRAFTLAELLIVVAIIGVLVGISIPIFTSQLEKSREATDIANMRAAKAAAVEIYYSGICDQDTASEYGFTWYYKGNSTEKNNAWAVYDAETGTFISTYPKNGKLLFADMGWSIDDAYGQGTKSDGGTDYSGYNNSFDYTNAVIVVTIFPNGYGTNIKQFNSSYSGMENVPCIILEWRRVERSNGTYPYVGRDPRDGSKYTAQVIFIGEKTT